MKKSISEFLKPAGRMPPAEYRTTLIGILHDYHQASAADPMPFANFCETVASLTNDELHAMKGQLKQEAEAALVREQQGRTGYADSDGSFARELLANQPKPQKVAEKDLDRDR